MTAALYRRYRPDTFADVVGQEHVTTPLMQALRADKVNHAYLFSGPRGCGKTTSARILARCLNCAEGPTDTPCGVCDSCTELARGGTGSVDVVEIDAASHNGVDDARELRERAAFAPARDRYKIFILDEAHMVTPQGFNALLKLVEEPPPHVRFIFATTEPEKVIGTIRSRTHHYPFRLVPPGVLTDYLQSLCEAEGVTVAAGVLPLVVRAGGGSVRDSLSVLDQLMAGSGVDGVTYDRAISLLGFTDATLLDDAIDAIAAADGASLFEVVGRVIGIGHEPRRFVEDLLERLRDILVLTASGEAGAKALGEVPEDQLERMKDQARHLGLARASRAGDLVNDALTNMVGATSPRLHLELLCARLIAADGAGAPGVTREAASAPEGNAPVAQAAAPSRPAPTTAAAHDPASSTRSAAAESTQSDSTPPAAAPAQGAPTGAAAARAAVAKPATETAAPVAPAPAPTPVPSTPPSPVTSTPTATPDSNTGAGDTAGGPEDSELVRRRWDEVLGTLERRRVTWVLVKQSAQVAEVDNGVLKLAFDGAPLASRFATGNHAENVGLAVRETLGLHVRVEGIVGPAGAFPAAATARPAASAPVASAQDSDQSPPTESIPTQPATSAIPQPPASDVPPWDDAPPEDDEPPREPSGRAPSKPETGAAAPVSRQSAPPSASAPAAQAAGGSAPWDDDEEVSEHDAAAPDAGLSGADMVAKMLGGKIIDE
ncbi:DNA polymerase III subunit gamma and tau [Demequina aurantiaca]|uniref:DNA polymerase III subunit gamma and tau n=1 Tax=Demequina aurantiaca TaxID=676200 RepID=UPI0007802712|nr:DNA polymerase III subunit gamma and tau [Demequina aurantiaca]